MSNRHWKFVNEELFRPLNDLLARRQGAEYYFWVPEGSFDWDVEFSVMKDRSGNKLREEYSTAWVRPYLVGPDDNTVRQLGVRLDWNSFENEFKREQVNQLMSAVDKVVGLPITKESETERVASVTRRQRLARALSLAQQDTEQRTVKRVFNMLQRTSDAKLLDSIQLQQVELQVVEDELHDLLLVPRSTTLAVVTKLLLEMIKHGEPELSVLYDVLSRLIRQLQSCSYQLGKSPRMKLEALNDLEKTLMSLGMNFGVELESDVLIGPLKDIATNDLVTDLRENAYVLEELRELLPQLRMYEVPSPQEAELQTERLTESVPFNEAPVVPAL